MRNIELIKGLGLANQEIDRLNKANSKILDLELRKVKYIRGTSFIQGTIVNLVRSIMVVFLLILIFDNEISPGKYFTFLLFSFTLFNPLTGFGNVVLSWRETQVSIEAFGKILSVPLEAGPVMATHISRIEKLEFDNITFRHSSSQSNALSHISFSVGAGKTIAFVGPSGSGKTTLIKLLIGLYQPLEGEIRYNDIAGNQLNLDRLRENIGFVTQDIQLFAGTIRENLLFVRPDATDEECMNALQKSACQSLLFRAGMGLDTIIGEGGVKVSGGEKQRLSIARALLRKPNVLIFDEATSSLDSITEEEITRTIYEISSLKDHITILVAHRLSTVMHADCIFVLEKGLIVGAGKHLDLIGTNGLYQAMWRQQIGERDHVMAEAGKE
ncbi:ABC transporter ATP-binding protein [Pedobacter lusitanus]|uniref:ABC transporter ATP-binding protein n=1 Tax=Pedobacter lusitanus TaxID=1503925 RepID=UPI000A9683D1|nr:ABC transporter ATP-binding protein [Pedobacter lusitanus]